MPTLDWIGKDKVINHHKDVPYKVLERKYSFDESGMHKEDIHSNNMIIHGDNLEALKSLLPQYEGKIKCIYIDPPYNTGNEGWIYNDNVNDPKIKKWLGEVVGKEGEDLSRHDKWLCMMYPRLVLLQKLLADDGAIFISIDDNEKDYLKLICNEIFGANYYMGTIVRATGQTTGQDSSGLGSSFDYVLVYSKSCDYIFGGLPLTEHDLKRFQNEDDRGNYAYDQLRKTGSNDRREDRPNMYYAIINPDGEELYPTATAGYDSRWRVEKKTYNKLVEDDLIFWKKTKRNNEEAWWPYVKYYAEGRTKRPSSLWTEIEGNKKVNSLLNEYAKKMFYEWVEQDKISCLPSYKLPREISPTNTIASIPKSLYSEEENFDTEYERKVVMELSSLNNVRWWHRNIARKGFSINGAINAYPDLMVKTESGKLLLIETKGDQLENSESKEKAETGAKWAEMAGRMYKYYMVFETKNPGYNGAYSYEEFMRIVKEL